LKTRSVLKCRSVLLPVLLTLSLFTFDSSSSSQECSPPAIAPSRALNLFNEQQEYDLGEVFAGQISYSLHVIEDERVAGYLQGIGDRLLENMPATKLHFRFFLVDSPTANAFAIPGGRVYVTRKLISTLHSEDELAGVMGHEMGHQLAHHGALNWSRIFHDVLGVTSVGDRADIEDKFNEVLDTDRTKRKSLAQADVEQEQMGADQVAIYAVARAGYSPQAVIEFWDRFTESQGKKGSWWSDYFGYTRPESKRLREFVNDLKHLPAGCIQAGTTGTTHDPSAFARWQVAVKNYSGFGKKESLPHVDLKRTLDPPLRGDIRQFRFSPDGRFVLALDEGSIFVLTREPLANLFRIDAPNATGAQFSTDSRYVVFYSADFRIERWNIAEQRLEDVREPYIFEGCVQWAVSPDGDYLACIRPDRDTFFPLDFQLYDTNTGVAVLTKKALIRAVAPSYNDSWASLMLSLNHRRAATMAFSPDGRYLVLGRSEVYLSEVHLMVDMRSLSEVSMPGKLRKITSYTFAFVGPDRVVGADDERLERASLVKMPSGEMVSSDIPTGGRTLFSVTRGLYAMVRPMPKAPLGLVDLESKKIFRASRTDATDVFDDVLVSERSNGEVALYRVLEEKPFATMNLPRAPLASLAAAAVSSDASAIAISQMSRGAVWSLATGQQSIYVRGFRGAFFGKDGLYLDFAPQDQFREIPVQGESEMDVRRRDAEMPGDAIVRADLTAQSMTEIASMHKRSHVRQVGQVILSWSPADDDRPNKDITLEARDAKSGKVIWSRFYAKGFPGIEANSQSDVAVFSWALGTPGAKEALQGDPDAKHMVGSLRESRGSYLVEVVDIHSGTSLGKFPIDTGRASFFAIHFLASGGIVAMIDTNNRTLLYSYKGERKGRFFGGQAALSPDGHRICLEQEPGRLVLYDIDQSRELDRMTFPERVVYASFSADDRHLVVMTADQTVYVFASLWPPSNSPSN
jgi:WD40 repeat protein